MKENSSKWLPHLTTSLPKEAYGYPVSMYSIALEGWRRGLTLKFENNNRIRSIIKYSLSDGKKTHSFKGSQGDLVSMEAIRICDNKHLTKEYLINAGVAVAQGEYFDESISNSKIREYANEVGYPVVIKPISGAGGRGVIANIKDERNLIIALQYVREELRYKNIILERHIDGKDYRVLVVGDKVVGAIHRIPANVIGDGKRTINQLLIAKNLEKKRNPAINDSPIKKDKETLNLLKSKGYNLDSKPLEGDRVYLKTKSNISAGGEPVDATDIITDEIKEHAVRAVKALPNLAQAGVDILWDSNTNNFAILEVNTIPSIRTHLFPMEGQARDVPSAIIDYYFPGTKTNHSHPLYYFEIADIFKGFTNNELTKVEVPEHPKGKLESRSYIISGVNSPLAFKRKTFRLAKKLKLNGFIKGSKKDSIEIVVSGLEDKVNEFKTTFLRSSKYRSIKETTWEKPIKIGFERIFGSEINKQNSAREKNSITLKERDRALKERDFYKKKYEDMKKSKLYKFLNMLRKLKNKIK